MVESTIGDDKSIIKQVLQNGDKRGKRPKQGNKVEMRIRISRITSSQFLTRKMDLSPQIKNWHEMSQDINVNFKVGEKYCEVKRDMRALTLSNLL